MVARFVHTEEVTGSNPVSPTLKPVAAQGVFFYAGAARKIARKVPRREGYYPTVITVYVWDANGDRRNLSNGQRAILAALRPGTSELLSDSTDAAR